MDNLLDRVRADAAYVFLRLHSPVGGGEPDPSEYSAVLSDSGAVVGVVPAAEGGDMPVTDILGAAVSAPDFCLDLARADDDGMTLREHTAEEAAARGFSVPWPR